MHVYAVKKKQHDFVVFWGSAGERGALLVFVHNSTSGRFACLCATLTCRGIDTQTRLLFIFHGTHTRITYTHVARGRPVQVSAECHGLAYFGHQGERLTVYATPEDYSP